MNHVYFILKFAIYIIGILLFKGRKFSMSWGKESLISNFLFQQRMILYRLQERRQKYQRVLYKQNFIYNTLSSNNDINSTKYIGEIVNYNIIYFVSMTKLYVQAFIFTSSYIYFANKKALFIRYSYLFFNLLPIYKYYLYAIDINLLHLYVYINNEPWTGLRHRF